MLIDNKTPDKELVQIILETNNQKAYAILVDRHKKLIMYQIKKVVHNIDDAEDIMMLSFSKAFKNLSSFNPEFAFTTWLARIGFNSAIDFSRKKRIVTVSLDNNISKDKEDSNKSSFSEHIFDIEPNPEEQFILDQNKQLMLDVVDTLSDKYKILVQLRFFEDLKYEEIAERLQLPLGTVKVQLSRAKNLLIEILKNQKGDI